jgi:hypothetical protein
MKRGCMSSDDESLEARTLLTVAVPLEQLAHCRHRHAAEVGVSGTRWCPDCGTLGTARPHLVHELRELYVHCAPLRKGRKGEP